MNDNPFERPRECGMSDSDLCCAGCSLPLNCMSAGQCGHVEMQKAHIRTGIKIRREKLAAAQEALDTYIRQAQAVCGHPDGEVWEAPQVNPEYPWFWMPGLRVCARCGYAEEDGPKGYRFLAGKTVRTVTREETYPVTVYRRSNQRIWGADFPGAEVCP